MALIRECQPQTIEEREHWYFENAYTEAKTKIKITQENLQELGERLYEKITEVVIPEWQAAFAQLTLQDCINYIFNLTINRTFDGYQTEIQTIYGQLQNILNVKIEPASDEWDRLFNVDFFIQINEKYIGLQIKPVDQGFQLPEIHKEYALQAETHKKFTAKFGGKVFYIFSEKVRGKKEIANKGVI
jgi:DNA repair exonuclease SbcCD nuclease subunit